MALPQQPLGGYQTNLPPIDVVPARQTSEFPITYGTVKTDFDAGSIAYATDARGRERLKTYQTSVGSFDLPRSAIHESGRGSPRLERSSGASRAQVARMAKLVSTASNGLSYSSDLHSGVLSVENGLFCGFFRSRKEL